MTTFLGFHGKLVPALRLGLGDKDDHVLLDTTLAWNDLVFVAHVLVAAAAQEFQEWTNLMNNEMLSIPDPEAIGKRILRMEEDIAKLKSLAPTYGIDLKACAAALEHEKESARSQQHGEPGTASS